MSSGFSVIQVGGRFWLIQASPLTGDPDITAYPASTPSGPFDPAEGRLLYRDPTIGLHAADDYRIMYEARAEPALSTQDTLVISYNVNSEAVTMRLPADVRLHQYGDLAPVHHRSARGLRR